MMSYPTNALRAQIAEALEQEDFYNLMQQYRHMPVSQQDDVIAAYNAVKVWLSARIEAALRAGISAAVTDIAQGKRAALSALTTSPALGECICGLENLMKRAGYNPRLAHAADCPKAEVSAPPEIERCREPAIVGINSHHFCADHIDEGMKRTLGPVAKALRAALPVLKGKK